MLGFERFLAGLFTPIPFLILLLGVGVILFLINKQIILSKIFILSSLIILILISTTGLPKLLISSKENQYKPTSAIYSQLISDISNRGKPVKWIVVLAGGVVNDIDIPVSSQLSPSSVIRLVEGIRFYIKYPGSKLILTGGNPKGEEFREAEKMRELAIDLGVNKQDIIIEKKSLSTVEQSIEVKKIVKGDDFLLVTSATHMPRAVAMFEKKGMKPYPIPTDFINKQEEKGFLGFPIPSSHGFIISEKGFYEIWAWVGAKLQGEI